MYITSQQTTYLVQRKSQRKTNVIAMQFKAQWNKFNFKVQEGERFMGQWTPPMLVAYIQSIDRGKLGDTIFERPTT